MKAEVRIQVKLGGNLYGLDVPVVEERSVPEGSTVEYLMRELASERGAEILAANTLAVVNGTLLIKSAYGSRLLAQGDRVSFFSMLVGG